MGRSSAKNRPRENNLAADQRRGMRHLRDVCKVIVRKMMKGRLILTVRRRACYYQKFRNDACLLPVVPVV